MTGTVRTILPAWLFALAVTWPAAAETPNRLVPCPRTSARPKFDGVLDDPIWRSLPPLTGFTIVGNGPAGAQTEARACYDDRNLYLGAVCQEPDMSQIVANVKDHDGDLRQDDCVEFTVGTVSGRMYHVIVSASGCLYDAWIDPGGWTDVSWDSGAEVVVGRAEKAWSVELGLPLIRLALDPKPGTTVCLHVLRYRRRAREASTLVPAPTRSPLCPTAVVRLEFGRSAAEEGKGGPQ